MMSRSSSFSAPAPAAREQRCLWSVSRVRPGTGRAIFCSCRALSLLCARHSPSDERPSSRFRGINSPTVRTVGSLFHGRPDPLPDAVNSPQAAGNGRHRDALPVPPVTARNLYVPFNPGELCRYYVRLSGARRRFHSDRPALPCRIP